MTPPTELASSGTAGSGPASSGSANGGATAGGDNVIDIGLGGAAAPAGDRRQHPGPGYWLRQARERRGWSQREAADMFNLSARFVVAMEDETFDKLPAPAFARGYLRAYAKLLNLSGDEIIRRYESLVGDDSDPYFNELRTARRQPVLDFVRAHPGLLMSVLGTMAAVLLLVALWWGWGLVRQQGTTLEPALDALGGAAAGVAGMVDEAPGREGESSATDSTLALPPPAPGTDVAPEDVAPEDVAPADVAPAAGAGAAPAASGVHAPAAAESNASQPITGAAQQGAAVGAAPVAITAQQAGVAQPAVTGPDRVDLSVAQSCWVDVRDATGSKVFSNNVAARGSVTIGGSAPFTIVLGNAPGARVSVNGKPVDVESNIRGRVATLVAGP